MPCTSRWQKDIFTRRGSSTTLLASWNFVIYFPIRWSSTAQPIENMQVTQIRDLLHIRTKPQERIEMILQGVKEGGLQQRRFNSPTLQKKPKEAKYRRGANSRLWGNLIQIDIHLKSTETVNKNGNLFKVYKKVDYSNCYIYGVYLYFMANRVYSVGRTCFFDCHNDAFFVWHMEMQDFQKPKVNTGIIPPLLRR